MADPIVYPASLPCPQLMPYAPTERRLVSPRPPEARNVQRDRHAMVEVTFPPMTHKEAETFFGWWRDELLLGGAWFAANWPMPQGDVTSVIRWLTTPTWQLVKSRAGDMRRISATAEVRGRGQLPTQPVEPILLFYVPFNSNLGNDLAPPPATLDQHVDVKIEDGKLKINPGSGSFDNIITWSAPTKFGTIGSNRFRFSLDLALTTVPNSTGRPVIFLTFGGALQFALVLYGATPTRFRILTTVSGWSSVETLQSGHVELTWGPGGVQMTINEGDPLHFNSENGSGTIVGSENTQTVPSSPIFDLVRCGGQGYQGPELYTIDNLTGEILP